jgi:hypothetical protein
MPNIADTTGASFIATLSSHTAATRAAIKSSSAQNA